MRDIERQRFPAYKEDEGWFRRQEARFRTWAEVVSRKNVVVGGVGCCVEVFQRAPLPWRIQRLREQSFSVFVSNLPQHFSNIELEAMFCRAGRIVHTFVYQRRKMNRGFAFVRFATKRKAENAVETANGRSWGGRKLQANLALFQNKVGRGRGSGLR